MKDYIRTEVTIKPWSEDMADFVSALLGDIGYESFTQNNNLLTAFINKDLWSESQLVQLIDEFPAPNVTIHYTNTIVPGQDWNHEWEKNYFQPITIGNKCIVKSSFHKVDTHAEYEILIDPKMAFGTGHHSTTMLMMQYLLENNLRNKTIIDMGTGTGILAILSIMRGAKEVIGVEIDPDAYENACDNAALNTVNPTLICGDADALKTLPKADILLANINRNIILADMDKYTSRLTSGGKFICSGFYLSDLDMIKEKAHSCGLKFISHAQDKDWIRAEFSAS